MAKLPRVTAKIFASNAASDDIGQFGSALSGTKVTTGDISEIQALAAYETGWRAAVISDRNYPTLQEMNGVQKTFSQQIAYLLQQGVPEWDSATTYYTNNFCAKNGKLYISKTDENLNNDPENDSTNWEEFTMGGSGNEVGDIIWRLLPSNDAGKHLLDGSLIQGSGIYSAFVDYIAGLYEDNPTANYFAQGYTEELTFNQPVLSANGTLGGDSFAVSASSEYSSTYAIWKACNGVSSDINNGWVSQTHNGQYYIFYNPIPLKVTNISIQNGDTTARAILEWEVLGSNDNSTWETITTGVNSNTAIYAVWNINLSNNTNYYKYYKISAITDSGLAAICELGITATYQGATFTPEQEWQATVAQYGACGKFVYDSTNNTVRLPKVTGIVEGTIDATALGDLIEAGLPPIIGTAGVTTDNAALMTGAFSWTRRTNNLVVYNPSGSYSWGTLTLDASQSSPIYGNSTTVQPQTIKGYYYIVVATSTKTDIQMDIDEIATDLNGKADTDLTNTTNQAKILMSGMPMPINRFIDLTIGASGATYTAPANGWFWITYEASTNVTGGWAVFINMNNGIIAKSWSIYSFGTSILLPIEKGEVMQMLWGGNPFVTNVYFRFYYAKGSESEAS